MNVTVHIPDEFADRLTAGGDVGRQALEALALESYRAGRLTKVELRRLLGFGTRYALDGFLKAHDVFEPGAAEDVEREVKDVRRAVGDEARVSGVGADLGARRRMTVDRMLAFGGEITALPILDTRSPSQIMDELNAP